MTEHRGTLTEGLFPLLAEALRPLNLERPELRMVIRQLEADGLFTPTDIPPEDHRGVHPGRVGDAKWYAVHTKDLTQLTFIATSIAAALANYGPTLGTGIAGIGALAGFLWILRREQVEIEPLEGHVLHTLNRRPGNRATVDELAAEVGLSPEKTLACLQHLKTLDRRNHNEGKLVDQKPDGTWVAVDLSW